VTNVTRASFNGGTGGLAAQPTPQQLAIAHEQHVPPTAAQSQHQQTARPAPIPTTKTRPRLRPEHIADKGKVHNRQKDRMTTKAAQIAASVHSDGERQARKCFFAEEMKSSRSERFAEKHSSGRCLLRNGDRVAESAAAVYVLVLREGTVTKRCVGKFTSPCLIFEGSRRSKYHRLHPGWI
jgi:hypothetical protein